jgi:hypothetical protein
MSSSSGIAGLIPGANSSGTQLAVPFAPQQGGQAALGGNLNPLLPINTSTSTSMPTFPQSAVSTSATSGLPAPAAAPSAPGGATSAFPANGTGTPSVPGGGSGSGSTNALGLGSLSPSQQSALQRNLSKTYGSGLASTILQFLQGGAGYNSAAINNLVSGLQPQFQQSQNDLLQQFSAGGARYGSGAQLGESNLLSQQNLQVGELESQMYEQAISNYMNVLMGAAGPTATRIENTPSTFDNIMSVISALKPGSNVSLPNGGGAEAAAAAGG